MTQTATVVLHSTNGFGNDLLTFKLRYPKFIHGELMTHRKLSRNASSSRAVPTAKLIEEVKSDALRAGPVWWGKNQSGMQAPEELSDDDVYQGVVGSHGPKQQAQLVWKRAALGAVHYAEALVQVGAHKQIVNRILEPFSHINVVATATDWDNFFGLRLHRDAQPEMRALAVAMWEAKRASKPQAVAPGAWHLPFVSLATPEVRESDDPAVRAVAAERRLTVLEVCRMVSVARVARVSYEDFETGKRSTADRDVVLYDRLMTSGHWSPFEHQATPDRPGGEAGWQTPREHGNFTGWRQLRKMLPFEAVAPLPEEYR